MEKGKLDRLKSTRIAGVRVPEVALLNKYGQLRKRYLGRKQEMYRNFQIAGASDSTKYNLKSKSIPGIF